MQIRMITAVLLIFQISGSLALAESPEVRKAREATEAARTAATNSKTAMQAAKRAYADALKQVQDALKRKDLTAKQRKCVQEKHGLAVLTARFAARNGKNGDAAFNRGAAGIKAAPTAPSDVVKIAIYNQSAVDFGVAKTYYGAATDLYMKAAAKALEALGCVGLKPKPEEPSGPVPEPESEPDNPGETPGTPEAPDGF